MSIDQARKLVILSVLNLMSICLFAQDENFRKIKYIILNLDDVESNFVHHTFFKTSDDKGKIAYILNIRYKTDNIRRKYEGESSDFIFTFYIFPGKDKLTFFKIKDTGTVINNRLKDVSGLERRLLNDKQDSYYNFEPVLKINNMYLQFAHNQVFGQAFSLLADHKYFPQYTRFSNKFELNLFDKPYTKKYMDSIRQETITDTTTLSPFDLFLDYDKWYVSKVDKQNKIINYWTNFRPISSHGYFFGRITSEITYKIDAGIIGFIIYPSIYDLQEEYSNRNDGPVRFSLQQVVDLKRVILTTPRVNQPNKDIKPNQL